LLKKRSLLASHRVSRGGPFLPALWSRKPKPPPSRRFCVVEDVALWSALARHMRLLTRTKVHPQEAPRASEVDDWLDRKIASLLREVESGKSSTGRSKRGSAARTGRRAGKMRAGRPLNRAGAKRAAASQMLMDAVPSIRGRGASIVPYAVAIALGVLVGWIAVVLVSHY
jgi:hypothetical protein